VINGFCHSCMKDVSVRIEGRTESIPVRGEPIGITARVAVCGECEEDVWIDELDDDTLARAFAEYRLRHHLLTPAEMQRIRVRWGLGQRAFSLLLGWGEISLHRYESGSLQDAAHDAQLRMAERPENVRILLEANGDRLTPRQREVVIRRLREAEEESRVAVCDDELERVLALRAAGGGGGEAPVSLPKIREAAAYLCEIPDVFATKLAKLMFYADFLHYKEGKTSITGLAYAHLPHGPVPEHYERIRAHLEENGVLTMEERSGDNWSGEVLAAARPPKLDVFSPTEMRALSYVRDQLGSLTSKAVSDRSHSEVAYTRTGTGERIPYATARSLSLSLPQGEWAQS